MAASPTTRVSDPDHALFMVQVPDVAAGLVVVKEHWRLDIADVQKTDFGLTFGYAAVPLRLGVRSVVPTDAQADASS